MSKVSDISSKLLALSEEQGYLLFDDIIDHADEFQLSFSELDKVTESLQLQGVIIYEETINYS